MDTCRQGSVIQHRISDTRHLSSDVSRLELDSHADSPVVGRGAHILSYTNKKVSVAGFTSELGTPLTVPVVNAAIAYDCNKTGEVYILVICNALYLRNLETHLIPPFIMRLAGVEIDECPRFLAKGPIR